MIDLSLEEAHKLREEYKDEAFLWHDGHERQRDFHIKRFIDWLYNTKRKIVGEKRT